MGNGLCFSRLKALSDNRFRSKKNIHTSKLEDSAINKEEIIKFLLKNPTFLDDFVQKQLSLDRLQQWKENKLETSYTVRKSIQELASHSDDYFHIEHVRSLVKALFFPNKVEESDVKNLLSTKEYSTLIKLDRIRSHLFRFSEIALSKINFHFIYMIEDLFGPKAFPKREFCNFLATVQANYYKVPFHNYKHAIGHAQSMYWIFRNSDTSFLSKLEMKTLMIASLTHDLGHPGFSDLLVHKTYPWAFNILFMEKSHSQLLFLILLNNDCDIFVNLPDNQLREVILDLKSCVLSPHFSSCEEVLEKFKTIFNDANEQNKEVYKYMIMELLMITCELSATWKLWPTHSESMMAMYTEISNRDKKMKTLDEEFEGVLSRSISLVGVEEFSIKFLSEFAIPLLEITHKIFPCLNTLQIEVNKNLQQWIDNSGKKQV